MFLPYYESCTLLLCNEKKHNVPSEMLDEQPKPTTTTKKKKKIHSHPCKKKKEGRRVLSESSP
jgi:hypothetical protein